MPGKYQNQIKVIDTIHELDLDFLGQSHSIYIKDSNPLAALKYYFPSWLVWDRNKVYCTYCYAQVSQKLVLTG